MTAIVSMAQFVNVELVDIVSAQAPRSYCQTNWKRNQKFHSLSWDKHFELCLAVFEF